MARPKKKPLYDAEKTEKIMKELLKVVAKSYDETRELKLTAEEFGMSPLKIWKLLITAGAYSNEISDEVIYLHKKGKAMAEIQQITGLGKSSVNGYLPHKLDELSLNAERIQVFRNRQQAVKVLSVAMNEDNLWKAVIAFHLLQSRHRNHLRLLSCHREVYHRRSSEDC